MSYRNQAWWSDDGSQIYVGLYAQAVDGGVHLITHTLLRKQMTSYEQKAN